MSDLARDSELCSPVKVPALRYLGYATFVYSKKILGLSTQRHRKFYVWKLIRLLQSGRVKCDQLGICSEGKRDGVGAQALAKFSAMCMAEVFGIPYVHRPFLTLAHEELPIDEWISAWENLLGMGRMSTAASQDDFAVIRLEELVSNPKFWNQKVLISSNQFHAFCELAPQYGQTVSGMLQEHYHHGLPANHDPELINICVHVRRGDVRIGDAETQHRYTANHQIIKVIKQINHAVSKTGKVARVKVFSNGVDSDFDDFRQLPNVELNLGISAIDTFKQLVNADVLVTARSDFSHLAAIYCRGIVICDPRHRAPLPKWLQIDPASCSLRVEALVEQINAGLNHKISLPVV